jgi:xylulose-5-phosphate/fructose-6-phosphate phosphoketolase
MQEKAGDHAGTHALDGDEMRRLDAWWRAANYLSVGQIYLMGNPLLREPLRPEHIKPRLLGHWGTTPGLNFVYAHLNRVIKARDLDVIYICGPGHGGPGMVASTYLEGTYSEIYPRISQDAQGMHLLFRQFSFPGGIPSHAAPDTPGSIHEGGELGYSLVHAYGAALDNPDLIVACVIGDGEAETGPLSASWRCNTFLNPATDGAVLPILHLNGYKIANPTILGRLPDGDVVDFFRACGYEPFLVAGSDPEPTHRNMARALDDAIDHIWAIQQHARSGGRNAVRPAVGSQGLASQELASEVPKWPIIILRTPKGWTGPKEVDGLKVEGFWRSHQVPLAGVRRNPQHLRMLEEWMRSYRPQELFDESGRLVEEIARMAPSGSRRMGANPHANGGLLRRELHLPDFRSYAVAVANPGTSEAEGTRIAGAYLRDVARLNAGHRNFRLVGPDETASNRLDAVFEATDRAWMERIEPYDVHLSHDGRVIEILSEHICQGLLEGYLLTGRHGLFACYEAFIHIVDSMFNQHAKWLKGSRRLSWRRPISSLNYLLTSHVWHQDHNGFSHQDPGFIDLVVNKKADIVRVYLPPDANSLLWVLDHCLGTWDRINVIVAGKQPERQWLSMDDAIKHCEAGIGIWDWASNDHDMQEPDVVMACAGDVPTLETVAAVSLLRNALPDLKIRVINVVDLMTLESKDHPHGISDADFDGLFTTSRPVIFAFHGYPWLIHRLTYRRTNHDNIHVRGYIEEGTTTTPFDMVVLNHLDRFHLAMDVIDRVPGLGARAAHARQRFRDRLIEHRHYVDAHGEDMPEIRNWRWRA